MPEKKYRVAVIGTGMIANAGHIPAWKDQSEVEVVAVADLDEDRAKLVAGTFDIPKGYGDWREMLAESQPDIVSICTPNAYHCEQSIAAMESGAHVLCEKAVATSHADAARMFECAERAGRVLFVCQSLRFLNQAMAAKEFIDRGRLGEVYFAELVGMRRRGIPTWGQFHIKEHSGGGPVYDLGVHQLDSLLWLLGNPRVTAVSATAFTRLGVQDEGLKTSLAESGAPLGVLTPREYTTQEFDVEDMAAGFIRLEGGIAVSFRVSWAANVPKETFNTTLLGTEGGLQTDPFTLATNMGSYQVDVTPRIPPDRDQVFAGHWGAAEHFLKVLSGEEELMVKPAEVLNNMAALDAIYRSAEEGREVRLD